MSEVAETATANGVFGHLDDACTSINAAMLLLRTDDGSRLGEAKALVRSVMFDLDNQMVERSGLSEQMEEYRNG
jgi:hypothetical protein